MHAVFLIIGIWLLLRLIQTSTWPRRRFVQVLAEHLAAQEAAHLELARRLDELERREMESRSEIDEVREKLERSE